VSLDRIADDKEKTAVTERLASHDEFFCAVFADKECYPRRGFGMFRGGEAIVIEVEFDSYKALYARERNFIPNAVS